MTKYRVLSPYRTARLNELAIRQVQRDGGCLLLFLTAVLILGLFFR